MVVTSQKVTKDGGSMVFKKVLILFKKKKKKEYRRKNMHLLRESCDVRFPIKSSWLAGLWLTWAHAASLSCLGDLTPSSTHTHLSWQNLLTMATVVRRLCSSEMPPFRLARESSLVYADFGLWQWLVCAKSDLRGLKGCPVAFQQILVDTERIDKRGRRL